MGSMGFLTRDIKGRPRRVVSALSTSPPGAKNTVDPSIFPHTMLETLNLYNQKPNFWKMLYIEAMQAHLRLFLSEQKIIFLLSFR